MFTLRKRVVRIPMLIALVGLLAGALGLSAEHRVAATPLTDSNRFQEAHLERAGFGSQTVRTAGSMDTTMLYLDCDGADIPAGNWWAKGEYAGSVDRTTSKSHQGADFTLMDLDRDGADVFKRLEISVLNLDRDGADIVEQ